MRPVESAVAAPSDSNSQLLSRAQGGDLSAFEALVGHHRDRVYAFGRRITGSEEAALEIAQESFLSAYLYLHEFQNEADFVEWVHRIAASHASLRMRPLRKPPAAAGQLDASKLSAGSSVAEAAGPDWSNELLERELSPELRRAIAETVERLPHRDREVFLFKDVSGLSCEQIARIRGESISEVKSRLRQARLSLREAIDRFYDAEVNGSPTIKPSALTAGG